MIVVVALALGVRQALTKTDSPLESSSDTVNEELAVRFKQGAGSLAAGRYREAILDLESVRETDPHYRDVTQRLALAYYRDAEQLHSEGRLDPALEQIQQALDLNPSEGTQKLTATLRGEFQESFARALLDIKFEVQH